MVEGDLKDLERIQGGIVVSCYTNSDYNSEFNEPEAVRALVRSVEAGGARGIRINLRHFRTVIDTVQVPVIGIEKKYDKSGQMRITPTMEEVKKLSEAGARTIAIDATIRARWDNLTLSEFVAEIKNSYGICVIGDISTFEEAQLAQQAGVDAVGTTLSGYTEYSEDDVKTLGTIPAGEPNIDLIRSIYASLTIPIIAEGRFWHPVQIKEAFSAGAHAVVVGTAISNIRKITEAFVYLSGSK